MVESLQLLLDGVIDYAGIYPPARLPLNEALRNYVKYKQGRDAWIVNRFICPAAKISELEAGLKWQDFDGRFGVCVTGRTSETTADFLANVVGDMKSARKVDRVFFDAFETRLPADLLDSAELGHVILRSTRSLEENTLLFLEVPITASWQETIPKAIEAIAKHKQCRAKLRTGGVAKDDFPTVEQVALFIAECARCKLPFKATAGLHHPIRKFDEGIDVSMHGFLNVFIAAAAAHAFRARPADLVPIIGATDPADFRCLSNRISVGNYHLSLKQIRASRDFALAYGSCSVTEPLSDLAHLGHAMRSAV